MHGIVRDIVRSNFKLLVVTTQYEGGHTTFVHCNHIQYDNRILESMNIVNRLSQKTHIFVREIVTSNFNETMNDTRWCYRKAITDTFHF